MTAEQRGHLQFEVADLVVDSEPWWTRTVQTVRDAALLGPVLVVTPSHALAQRLGETLPFATVRQSDETAGQAASRMAGSPGAAVLILFPAVEVSQIVCKLDW